MMLLVFVKIAGGVCGLFAGLLIAFVATKDNRDFNDGYNSAVRDIMRYGFYYENGEKHTVENIRLWSD